MPPALDPAFFGACYSISTLSHLNSGSPLALVTVSLSSWSPVSAVRRIIRRFRSTRPLPPS